MILSWTEDAWEDYEYWQRTSKEKVKQIGKLIKAIKRDPFKGIGKPEPLKYDLAGYWFMKFKMMRSLSSSAVIITKQRYNSSKSA